MRYARSAQTAWRRIVDETVVIDLHAKRMIALNASGGVVWEALSASSDLSEITAGLGADAETLIRRFVEELASEGLVEPVVGAASAAETAAAAPIAVRVVPFVPPAITWREELLRFGGACNKNPDENPFCNQFPFSS
jgi:hypothetical protein